MGDLAFLMGCVRQRGRHDRGLWAAAGCCTAAPPRTRRWAFGEGGSHGSPPTCCLRALFWTIAVDALAYLAGSRRPQMPANACGRAPAGRGAEPPRRAAQGRARPTGAKPGAAREDLPSPQSSDPETRALCSRALSSGTRSVKRRQMAFSRVCSRLRSGRRIYGAHRLSKRVIPTTTTTTTIYSRSPAQPR
jgi:hypothetical protein